MKVWVPVVGAGLSLLLSLFVLLSVNFSNEKAIINKLSESSVQIIVPTKDGKVSGSGVTISKNGSTYVLTAGHVVDSAIVMDKGKPNFRDVLIHTEYVQDGTTVGEMYRTAKVIRFSSPENGDDLALLKVNDSGWHPPSVRFNTEVPYLGQKIYHVGSAGGLLYNSFSRGEISYVGRLLGNKSIGLSNPVDKNIKPFDQVTSATMPGCSGGGVFNQKAECIGLLTQGIRGTDNFGFIVPSRRILEFAKRSKCEWFMNDKMAVEDEDNQDVLIDGKFEPETNPFKIIFSPRTYFPIAKTYTDPI